MYKKKTVLFAFLLLLVYIMTPYTQDCSAKDIYIYHQSTENTSIESKNDITENSFMLNLNTYRIESKPLNIILK